MGVEILVFHLYLEKESPDRKMDEILGVINSEGILFVYYRMMSAEFSKIDDRVEI